MYKSVVFIGHNECWNINMDSLRNAIINLIEDGAVNFLSGGMGNFDWITARIVYELKDTYPNIKNILVIPYLTFKIRNKNIFDEILFPENFEKYHFKAAIIKRNRYMVDNSQCAVCYVKHSWGGAAKTYDYAKKCHLSIIDIDD